MILINYSEKDIYDSYIINSREIYMSKKTRFTISVIINIIMVIITCVGLMVMVFNNHDSATGLTATGLENLKFYTVLTNLSAGIVALYVLIYWAVSKKREVTKHIVILKLMSVAGVGLTFFTVALFLGPIYGHSLLYRDANLYFHLILPLVSMIEFLLLCINKSNFPFRYSFLTMIPPFIYGVAYLGNIMINGKGEWPETNDWYGFLTWGYPVGIAFYLVILFVVFLIGFAIRKIKDRMS